MKWYLKEGYIDLTQSSKLELTAVSNNNNNVARIGGVSLLPNTIPWPQNPEGENLTFLFHLPATFINKVLHTQYDNNTAISVFTTYDPNTYFLDNIVYHGDPIDLAHIQKGYTKVILHPTSEPRNESEFTIPAQALSLGEVIEQTHFTGSKIGGDPSFLQQEHYEFGSSLFALQFYGNDCGNEFNDIFYLSDAVGYLFLNHEVVSDSVEDAGLFFVQCT